MVAVLVPSAVSREAMNWVFSGKGRKVIAAPVSVVAFHASTGRGMETAEPLRGRTVRKRAERRRTEGRRTGDIGTAAPTGAKKAGAVAFRCCGFFSSPSVIPYTDATPTRKTPIACLLVAVEPPKAKAVLGARISELSRTQLFTTADSDTYQRLLRLSQPFAGHPQLGAVASGPATSSHQIALYDVAAGDNAAPKPRGAVEISKEAIDLDVIQTAEDQGQVLYCDDYDIYTVNVPKTDEVTAEPAHVYTIPHDDSSGLQPALRCPLRRLSPLGRSS